MHRSILTLIAVGSALASAASTQQFLRDLTFPAQNIWTDGVETVDVDADGDLDIVFANGSAYGSTGTGGAQPQHLFLNDGFGGFTAAHAQLGLPNFNAKMVIAEDFDNDGDPDLMFCSGSALSPPRLVLNDGTGNFTDVSATNLPSGGPNLRSFSLVAGDIDDDGDLDVAITDGGTFGGIATQQRLWTNDGSAVFTDVTASQMPSDNYNCQDVTFVDFDGDFDVDLLLTGKGGTGKRGRLYLNDGAGNFSIDSAMDQVGTGSTYEADWSDLDGDGDFDANVQSISGVNEGWARNDGNGVAMAEFSYPAPNGADDNEMAQMDVDNDGDHDCFVGSLSGTEKLWRNDGGGTFVNQNSLIQAISDATLDIAIFDADGDGRYDLLTAQGEGGNFTNKLYLNRGSFDTNPPVFMASNVPGSIGASGTVVHVQVKDAVTDDGHINADVTFSYSGNTGSGSGTATRMGNGLFRVAVPSTGATTSLSIDITATDHSGNVAALPTINLGGGAGPWTDLGGGKAGTGGIVPVFTGTGPLTAGSNNSVDLSSGLPGTTTNVVLGLSLLNLPFKGGTLVPSADVLLLGLPVDNGGNNSVPFVWPNGIPAGAKMYLQHWLTDGGASFNLSASNGLEGEAQ